MRLEILLGALGRFVRITRKQALVQTFGRLEHRLAAQQDIQEPELLNMPAEHDQTYGERSRQKQPHGSPEPGPEDRRGEDRDRGEAGAGAIEPGFNDVAADQLQDDEEGCRPEQHGPARIDSDRKGEREGGGDDRSDERHEAQDDREHAPEQRIGHADQPQADADGNAVGDVHDQLHQQIAAHPLGSVAQGLRCPVQIAGAEQPDEAVAQVLPLQQHEHNKDDDDACGCQRLDQGSDDRLQHLQRRGVGLSDLNRDGIRFGGFRFERGVLLLFRRRFRRLLNVMPEIAQHLRRALDKAAAGSARLQGPNLLPNIVLIARQAGAELRDLTRDDEPEDEDAQEGEENHGDDRGGSRDSPTAERCDQRREREAEKARQRKRHEHVASEIKRRDDNHEDGQGLRAGGARSWQYTRLQTVRGGGRSMSTLYLPIITRPGRKVRQPGSSFVSVGERECDNPLPKHRCPSADRRPRAHALSARSPQSAPVCTRKRGSASRRTETSAGSRRRKG